MDVSNSDTVYTKQGRIAELAKKAPEMALTSLSRYMDLDWLKEAFRRVRKDGAKGVDGQSGKDYAENLDANLKSLLDRAKSGDHYKAPPVRRTYIPKGDGKTMRPLGIPTFEDKVLQRAVVMLLEPLYEQDFLNCSYGFRPRKSAHQALQEIWNQMMSMGGGWVLDADIRSYFDKIDHAYLREILSHRMGDGVVKRLIGKWLKAGVWEKGEITYPETGSPQGGVISPMLANIYLNEVLDIWFENDVKPRLQGRAFLVRFADDFIMGFELGCDAQRVREALPKRFQKFGLELHPDKTKMVDFRVSRDPKDPDGNGPGSFDFLGFTHHWGKSLKGKRIIQRKTAKDRFSRAIKKMGMWMRKARHLPIRSQHKTLSSKLSGHYNYYGITGNSKALTRYQYVVCHLWRKWLSRRSRKARLNWEKMKRLLTLFPLPPPIATHSILRQTANP
jgi:group II intron reverse transcriptase/maturase